MRFNDSGIKDAFYKSYAPPPLNNDTVEAIENRIGYVFKNKYSAQRISNGSEKRLPEYLVIRMLMRLVYGVTI